jgi:hypothetical protein
MAIIPIGTVVIDRTEPEDTNNYGVVVGHDPCRADGFTVGVEMHPRFLSSYQPWFPGSYGDESFRGHRRVVHFKPTDLEPCDDWPRGLLVEILFGHLWTSKTIREQALKSGTRCEHRGCVALATGRALVNEYGHVYEADLCAEHYRDFHGMMVEDPPFNLRPDATRHDWSSSLAGVLVTMGKC